MYCSIISATGLQISPSTSEMPIMCEPGVVSATEQQTLHQFNTCNSSDLFREETFSLTLSAVGKKGMKEAMSDRQDVHSYLLCWMLLSAFIFIQPQAAECVACTNCSHENTHNHMTP